MTLVTQGQIPDLGILDILLAEAQDIYERARDVATEGGRKLTGTIIMFSGGNDSTTVAHLFRNWATAAAHCNTGIGIEETRQFVRDTCAGWELPLIEKHVQPGRSYRDLVLGDAISRHGPNAGQRSIYRGGFPGPLDHSIMFGQLKERAMEAIQREYVRDHRRERVIFIGGVRRPESRRRRARPAVSRKGSVVWAQPLINWSKLDLNEYRRRNPGIPRNEVADKLHMSGECLCGCYAKSGELDEVGFWYPEVMAEIRALQDEVRAAGFANCVWGGGAGSPCEGICNT